MLAYSSLANTFGGVLCAVILLSGRRYKGELIRHHSYSQGLTLESGRPEKLHLEDVRGSTGPRQRPADAPRARSFAARVRVFRSRAVNVPYVAQWPGLQSVNKSKKYIHTDSTWKEFLNPLALETALGIK